MRPFRTLAAVLVAAAGLPIQAQSEAGLLIEAGAEKKLGKKLSLTLDADLRTRNNLRTWDRWSLGLGAEYKLTKWLKASGGYVLLRTNFSEKVTRNSPTLYNNWRPSYWGTRHRLHLGLTASHKFANNIKLSLRERWQYTYRPERTVERWDFDNAQWENTLRNGAARSQLRSRLQVSYDKKKAKFEPYASIEMYNSWAVEKIRYTVGTDYHLTKQHTLGLFYRFQKMHNVDPVDNDPDMHYIGIGYNFKF